jgi:cytoskeleton protein RodZ
MTSIGDTLRRERQRRNLELPKIAGELKISARFLEAMEQDDFAKLPGGVFTKSFLRQYAVFLGFDGDEVVSGMEHAVEPETNGSHLADKPKPDVPGIDLEMGEENWQSVRERRAPLPSWFRAGVLLVVLMLTCSGVYWWWQRPRHREVADRQVLAHEIPPPKANPATEPAPPVSRPAENPPPTADSSTAVPTSATQASNEQASKEQLSKAAPAEATPAPQAATPAIPVAPPNPNATVRVGITADEDVWVRADVNGKYQFSGTLMAHESRNIDVDGEVTLRLGNAGGATLTLNGKPVPAVGPKGQIRTVQFTSGGFQIVSAAKLLDPLERL